MSRPFALFSLLRIVLRLVSRRTQLSSRKAEADEAYLLGIARKAAPVERLQNKHREFQKRMMSSINAAAATTTTPEPAAPSASSSSSTRRALAEAPSSSSSSRTRASRTGSARTPGQLATPSPAPSAPRPNGRMQVFVDPSGADAENDPSAAAPWPELGTRKSRVKENVPEVRKAAGTTLRAAGRSSRAATAAASGSRIPVYRDPEPGAAAEMPPPPVPSPAAAAASAAKKSALVVFRDEEDGVETPATPAFTPYRDEEVGALSPCSALRVLIMLLSFVFSSFSRSRRRRRTRLLLRR